MDSCNAFETDKEKELETVLIGPLTFELHTLLGGQGIVRYGVKVFLGKEKPFITQTFVPQDQSAADAARNVLKHLKDALEDPDELWCRIIKDGQIPDAFLPVLKAGFAQMTAWASERPDSIRDAASQNP